jgi:hypothetical protein
MRVGSYSNTTSFFRSSCLNRITAELFSTAKVTSLSDGSKNSRQVSKAGTDHAKRAALIISDAACSAGERPKTSGDRRVLRSLQT